MWSQPPEPLRRPPRRWIHEQVVRHSPGVWAGIVTDNAYPRLRYSRDVSGAKIAVSTTAVIRT